MADFYFKKIGSILHVSAYVTFSAVAISIGGILFHEGVPGFLKHTVLFLRTIPGIDYAISKVLDSEVKGAVKLLGSSDSSATSNTTVIAIPEHGLRGEDILKLITGAHERENSAETGKAFAYTYTTAAGMKELACILNLSYTMFSERSGSGNLDHEDLLDEAWNKFMHSNALNPMMYPSLRKFETEIISMTAWMTRGDAQTAGSLTSGGTESILMAVKTYRDRAKN